MKYENCNGREFFLNNRSRTKSLELAQVADFPVANCWKMRRGNKTAAFFEFDLFLKQIQRQLLFKPGLSSLTTEFFTIGLAI
ncbi:hypothetical protein TNCT_359721 [Trichonephila clavata]|uniref:Uncharacterized protein n=1 Tax=Trichonephila clavata TaxID=2740835 RepID=A0A8X6KWS3_TRICU|nr:hypothetical protein TNCT_359721 [Trichonephila clavata]